MTRIVTITYKSWLLSLALLVPVAACDDDDGGDDSAGDSANNTQGGEEGGGMTSSSEEVCDSQHSCINGSCQCETATLEGMPCTDDDACEEECEICM